MLRVEVEEPGEPRVVLTLGWSEATRLVAEIESHPMPPPMLALLAARLGETTRRGIFTEARPA